jgi:hypothetical protein
MALGEILHSMNCVGCLKHLLPLGQDSFSLAVVDTGRDELGALLRRERLYSSHLTRWREQRRTGRPRPRCAAYRPR